MLQGSLSISIFVAWKVNWYHCCYCLAEARGVCESASVVILVEAHRIFLRFYSIMCIRFLQRLTLNLLATGIQILGWHLGWSQAGSSCQLILALNLKPI